MKTIDNMSQEKWDVIDEWGSKTGEEVVRGELLSHQFHRIVNVWIKNARGQYLISKRASTKSFPDSWECTGGSVLAGESSIDAAVREVFEELGLRLEAERGVKVACARRRYPEGSGLNNDLCDVWVFDAEFEAKSFCGTSEVSQIRWTDVEGLRKMLATGEFLATISYIPEIKEECATNQKDGIVDVSYDLTQVSKDETHNRLLSIYIESVLAIVGANMTGYEICQSGAEDSYVFNCEVRNLSDGQRRKIEAATERFNASSIICVEVGAIDEV